MLQLFWIYIPLARLYIYLVCRQFADRRFGDGRKDAGRILDRRKYAHIYLLFFRPIYI